MAVLYATEATGYLNSAVPSLPAGAIHGGQLRRYRASITLASQATTDTIVLCRLHAGQAVAYGIMTSSVTLGSSTVAIGITGTTGKYRAAATFTAVNTPTLFGPTAATMAAAPTTAEETIFVTIAAADLPSSGTLVIDLYVSGT
jgi:hypothetical protein